MSAKRYIFPNKGIAIGDDPFYSVCNIWAHLYFTPNPIYYWMSWCLHWLIITPYYWAKNRKQDRLLLHAQQTSGAEKK